MTGDNTSALDSALTLTDVQNYIIAFTIGKYNSVKIEWKAGKPPENYAEPDPMDSKIAEVIVSVHTDKRVYSIIARQYDDNKKTTYLGVAVMGAKSYELCKGKLNASGWNMLASGDLVLGTWFRVMRDMFVYEALEE